jgi:hypothetical protein
MNRHIHIRAHGEIYYAVGDTLPELKSLVVEAVGQPVRRISRFMQLALIGAGRCARGQSLPRDTAVYLSSGRGDLEITLDVMHQVFREGQAPKPLSFVNTVSNSAAFYVAKCLQFEARSSFVCNRYFAFESALQLATIDLESGAINSALVGAVDGAVAPLDAHRERLGLHATDAFGEASHWVWLTSDAPTDSNAEIIAAHSASHRDELLTWIKEQRIEPANCAISAGQYLSPADFSWLKEHSGIEATFAYRKQRAYYDSQSAAAIGDFLRANAAQRVLLHINGDVLGRYVAMLVETR